MSDYVHKKVIRLPFPNEILNTCNESDAYDCQDYLKDKLGRLWQDNDRNSFDIEVTEDATYLDWVYYSTYGESAGDFGSSRMLTGKELNTIRPCFGALGVSYNDEDLRVVEYIYYNCSEAPDIYAIDADNDDSEILISNN